MFVEIVTPEAVLYKGEATSVSVPSVKGEFQILEGHAPVVAVLTKGIVKLRQSKTPDVFLEKYFESAQNELNLKVKGGTIELKNDRIIILAD